MCVRGMPIEYENNQIIPDDDPNNATSKYKLILRSITVNSTGYVDIHLPDNSAEQTLMHTLLSHLLPLLSLHPRG